MNNLFSDYFCKVSLACRRKNGAICRLCKQQDSCKVDRGFLSVKCIWGKEGREKKGKIKYLEGQISLPVHHPWHFLCELVQIVLYVSNIEINLDVRKILMSVLFIYHISKYM